ncbi:hypothetical protein GGR51DRAFT_505473 [Nemania sp. FL0031]|nr:hypothetical protein GGR51DRAFT_505473 [Nemania sp. FL0031]
MSIWGTQTQVSGRVTVQRGPTTLFYFIPITGLQEGTHFRDIWVHLKKAVKRLEHIEVPPGSQEGWICVYKYITYLKVMESLKEPVYVQWTGRSECIKASNKNVDGPVTIQLPLQPSRYIVGVIGHVLAWRVHTLSQVPSIPKPNPKDCAPVIAHGTYIPGKGFGPFAPDTPGSEYSSVGTVQSNSSVSNSTPATTCEPYNLRTRPFRAYVPLPPPPPPSPQGHQAPVWGEAYRGYGWCSNAPTGYALEPFGRPALQALHTVMLSGFHYNTTMREIRKFVEQVAARRRLKDKNFRFVEGVTIVTKFKSDAKLLRDCLDGRRLRGVAITATRGKLPMGSC